jgi:signal transduction histidine kinase
MSRLAVGGLRWRLMIALVATSALTLAVAAAVLFGPLRDRLREQSIDNLRNGVLTIQPEFEAALTREPGEDRARAIGEAAFELQQRTDARVLVDANDDESFLPDFYYDTEFSGVTEDAAAAALKALREETTVTVVEGNRVEIAQPLLGDGGATVGVMVAERRLNEVATAVDQVRNALVAATGIGLLVAVVLALAISSTLLRRLARLRAAAARITAEGPGAPRPRDTARDEVGDLARALARMQDELRRQEAARRSFVATASHELRTPITMLQGTMELLEEDLRNGDVDIGDAQRQVASARRELLRLSTLAAELLDLSRLDAAVQLRSEPVELGELARAVAAEFELRASERDVVLDVVPPREACWGRGDPDAVARVVRILLDNAMRYAPPGEPVRVIAGHAGEHAVIEVADRGPGIEPDEREHVFERFHRGRAAGPESGFGLGLAIGRELAERMGGSLTLAEQAEPGAHFVLALREAGPEGARPATGEPAIGVSS